MRLSASTAVTVPEPVAGKVAPPHPGMALPGTPGLWLKGGASVTVSA
jgi:hypothetical protein